jgi:flagellar motility protein MotE (MotC chaperone)
MKFLQSKVFAAVLGSVVFMLTTAFLTTHGLVPAASSEDEHGEGEGQSHKPNSTGASWAFFNPELEQIVSELKAERDAVAAKDKQLNELATRLRAERAELDESLKTIKKLQQQVDRDVYRIKDDEAVNLKKLSKMYASMEPAGAARILHELDDVVVVKILGLMKEAETGLILESMSRLGAPETKRAAALSESLRAAAAQKGSSGASPTTSANPTPKP